jgi:hypothetical protein
MFAEHLFGVGGGLLDGARLPLQQVVPDLRANVAWEVRPRDDVETGQVSAVFDRQA